MGPKKSRGGKVLATIANRPDENHSDFSNLSSVDKVSFLEGLQKNDDKPLHSTALEEDLNILEDRQVAHRNDDPQMVKATTEMCGAAVRRNHPETQGETETEEEKRSKATADSRKKLVGKKPAKPRNGQKAVVRPVKNEQMKRKQEKSKLTSGKSGDSHLQEEESESGTSQKKRRKILSSEEECQSPQKANVNNLSTTKKSSFDRSKSQKSSSGGTSADPEKADVSDHRKRSRGHRGKTDLDMVVDAFLDFCDKYRESVESKAVKQSIDLFSNNVRAQLLEKISSNKEVRFLKRENAKVGSLICRKTQEMLDAKNELMRAERQVWLLQKDKAELEFRLSDLRQGYSFLHDIRELNRRYLDYRDKHHKEKETYGASSSPALLLEQQLKGISHTLGRK